MKGKFVHQLIQTLGTSGLSMLFGIVTSIVVIRSLGPEGRGLFSIVTQVVMICGALGLCGLPEVMLSQMRADRRQATALAANSLVVISVATIISAGGLWISQRLLANSVYQGVQPELLWLAFGLLPLTLGIQFFPRLVQLDGRVKAYNALTLLQAVTGLVASASFLWLWPGRPAAAVLGLGVSLLGPMLAAMIWVRRKVAPGKWRVEKTLLLESLRGGWKVQLGLVAVALGQSVGIFLLNSFVSLKQVGYFSVAVGVANFLLHFSQSMRTVLQAWMPGEGTASGEVAERTLLIARHTGLLLLFSSLVPIMFALPLIRLLYGLEFEAAYGPMLILLGAVLCRGVGQVVGSYLAYEQRLGLPSIASWLGLGVNVVFAVTLIPTHGMYGAAVAMALGQLVGLLFVIGCFLSLTQYRWSHFWPIRDDFVLYRNWLIRYLKPTGV